MTQNQQQAHVFAAIDHSPMCQSATDYASWIAKTVEAPLTLLHNLEHAEPPAKSDFTGSIGLGSREHLLEELADIEAKRNKLLLEQGKALLLGAEVRASSRGAKLCQKLQRHGSLSETLVELEEQIRVLVLGVRGQGHTDDSSALGHQIESIIRSLHKPVLVVNKAYAKPEKLMLAYDGSTASTKALDWLVSSPLYKDMTCHVVHVCDNQAKGEQVLKHAEDKLTQASISCISRVITGSPLEELISYQASESIDLMVMGSFGHSRLREMVLGSLTLKLLTRSSIPLLLLR
jgi:nucleotide-binding universal stress UspA family protein